MLRSFTLYRLAKRRHRTIGHRKTENLGPKIRNLTANGREVPKNGDSRLRQMAAIYNTLIDIAKRVQNTINRQYWHLNVSGLV